ncbi:hypothetical protein [Cystobacter ferrugineus]|nr:hypothetical protein [Cystobacter ferrugineus]
MRKSGENGFSIVALGADSFKIPTETGSSLLLKKLALLDMAAPRGK